jgi:putative tricarboxylic transport membrane protein
MTGGHRLSSSRAARKSLKYTLLAAAAALCTWGSAGAQEWKPQRNVDVVVPSGPGGTADRQARVAQKYLQTFPGVPSTSVTNRAGGGGNLAYTFLAQHAGDPHFISTMATSLLTNQIIGVSQVGYRDLTPLNIMVREYIAVWVRSGSPISSAQDLAARLKKDPGSVTFAFSTARGNQNHVLIGMLARAAGADPKALKTVVYASGGQGMMAALGGHVDVWVGTAGGSLAHMQSGAARVLAVTSPQRQPGALAQIPTLKEQGVDAVYYAWRGFVAPGGLTPAQTAFWDQAFQKMVNAEDWKKVLDENGWVGDFKGVGEARKHLDAEHEMLRKILGDLGVTPAAK